MLLGRITVNRGYWALGSFHQMMLDTCVRSPVGYGIERSTRCNAPSSPRPDGAPRAQTHEGPYRPPTGCLGRNASATVRLQSKPAFCSPIR